MQRFSFCYPGRRSLLKQLLMDHFLDNFRVDLGTSMNWIFSISKFLKFSILTFIIWLIENGSKNQQRYWKHRYLPSVVNLNNVKLLLWLTFRLVSTEERIYYMEKLKVSMKRQNLLLSHVTNLELNRMKVIIFLLSNLKIEIN